MICAGEDGLLLSLILLAAPLLVYTLFVIYTVLIIYYFAVVMYVLVGVVFLVAIVLCHHCLLTTTLVLLDLEPEPFSYLSLVTFASQRDDAMWTVDNSTNTNRAEELNHGQHEQQRRSLQLRSRLDI